MKPYRDPFISYSHLSSFHSKTGLALNFIGAFTFLLPLLLALLALIGAMSASSNSGVAQGKNGSAFEAVIAVLLSGTSFMVFSPMLVAGLMIFAAGQALHYLKRSQFGHQQTADFLLTTNERLAKIETLCLPRNEQP